jgi:hypothetical protein
MMYSTCLEHGRMCRYGIYITVTYSLLPEDDPLGSKHVEYIRKSRNISLTKVHFVDLY